MPDNEMEETPAEEVILEDVPTVAAPPKTSDFPAVVVEQEVPYTLQPSRGVVTPNVVEELLHHAKEIEHLKAGIKMHSWQFDNIVSNIRALAGQFLSLK